MLDYSISVFDKIQISVVLIFNCLFGNAVAADKLSLKIDSLFINADTIEAQPLKSGYSVQVFWSLSNGGKNTINTINPLWYIYSENVQSDSVLRNGKKATVGCCGIGNALIKLTCGDSTYTPSFVGFIESPGDNRRINLKPKQTISGKIGGFFDVPKLSDSAFVIVEYNTLYQQTSIAPIWRGVIRSQKMFVSSATLYHK
jgi:hypothetical protein